MKKEKEVCLHCFREIQLITKHVPKPYWKHMGKTNKEGKCVYPYPSSPDGNCKCGGLITEVSKPYLVCSRSCSNPTYLKEEE